MISMKPRTRTTPMVAGLLVLLGACAPGDPAVEGEPSSEPAAEAAGAEAADESTPAPGASALLNPNLAGEDELGGVPGMTDGAATAILEGRPFLDMLALDAALAGAMDEAAREALYGHLWVPLDLNTASSEEIGLIPGVGERMTHEFEEYRPYDGMARFRREIGKYVDEAEVERLAAYVFVPIDLNTATDEEILAIPGVGPRMLHEFKEYRPYTSMEQFRREIGKYVDEAELARLERYVTIAGG